MRVLRNQQLLLALATLCTTNAFVPSTCSRTSRASVLEAHSSNDAPVWNQLKNMAAGLAAAGLLSVSLLSTPAWAENELSAKYGGGLDTSLVDQTCLVDKCSLQAKACLADDPSCRKGLTCTAKCLGDNACITGCMARYGDKNLDNLLKCTIEDNECIKVAILEGGADPYGQEPRSPAPTVRNFDPKSLQGSWYKVVGFNPNYDCYACQRNSFTLPRDDNFFVANNRLQMDVEFSMPHLLPDGSPPPPSNVRELIQMSSDEARAFGGKSIGLNDYSTRETMVFDNAQSSLQKLVINKGTDNEVSYSRTAHSEGEMFGLSKCAMVGAVHGRIAVISRSILQSFGRTGISLARTILVRPSSNSSTIMARPGKTRTRAPLSTVAPRICPQSR